MRRRAHGVGRCVFHAAEWALGIALGTGVAAGAASAQSAAPPGVVKQVPPLNAEIEVTDLVAQGSGCPQGSFDTSVFDNNGAKSVLFAYRGFHQAFAEAPSATLDCHLKLKVKHPSAVSLNLQNVSSLVRFQSANLDASLRYRVDGGAPQLVRHSLTDDGLGHTIGGPDRAWSACATEHELEADLSVAPTGTQAAASQFTVTNTWFSIAARACPLAEELPEKLVPKVLRTSISGRACGRVFQPTPAGEVNVNGLLYDLWESKQATTKRCTVRIDLQVPTGYQFRGAHFDWVDFIGPAPKEPIHYAATYAYSSAESQRTEWSYTLPDSVWDGLRRSRHRVDLWSPTCARPGQPVQLTIDVQGSHDGIPNFYGPAGLELVARFRNRAALDNESGEPAAEWRRCPPAAP